MLIKSNFKDFYDYGCIYGIDKTHVYVRKHEKIELNKCSLSNNMNLLGICGKIYQLYNPFSIYPFGKEHKKIKLFSKLTYLTDKNDEVYDFELEKNKFWKSYRHYCTNELDRYIEDKISEETFLTNIKDKLTVGKVKHKRKYYYTTHPNEVGNKYKYIFKKHKVPIFYVFCDRHFKFLHLNPQLTQLGVAGHFNPIQLYQEIEMFIVAMNGPQDPEMPVGDDKLIAKTHGFDRFSFRKRKEK
jgi:hypothetical protein